MLEHTGEGSTDRLGRLRRVTMSTLAEVRENPRTSET